MARLAESRAPESSSKRYGGYSGPSYIPPSLPKLELANDDDHAGQIGFWLMIALVAIVAIGISAYLFVVWTAPAPA